MASQWGRQSTRWSTSRRATGEDAAGPSSPEAPGPDGQTVPATAPDTADIYRSLFDRLRRAFGGTIDHANADAISFAAAELYHGDVEPRLWDEKTAQEVLDELGVPRTGAFTRYSLADRLLLLRRSAGPDRTDRADALLTDLGVPELGAGDEPLSRKERLDWLLEGVGPPTPVPRQAGDREEERAGGERAGAAGDGTDAGSGGPGAQQVVDGLGTIRQAAADDDAAPRRLEPAGPPAEDPAGVGAALATIQEELIQLRQAVQTVQISLDEVLTLLRASTGNGVTPPVVESAPAIETVTTVGRRRRRRLPILILIAVVVGLLIAGAAILISMVGWNELRSEIGAVADLVATAVAQPLAPVRPLNAVG